MLSSTRQRNEALRAQQSAAQLSLYSNIALVMLKVFAGLASHAISILAEGVQSGLDVFASLMILWTVQAAALPPDRSHPYGHGKMENLVSLAQIILIVLSAFYIGGAAWERWLDPKMPHVGWGSLALVISLGVNFVVSRRLQSVAKATESAAIATEAAHLRSDMLSCAGVLGGLAIAWVFKEPRLDPLIAAVMAIIVIVSAIHMGRQTLRPLLDEKLPGEEEAQIKAVLDADRRVLGYHRLRTRQAGSHRLMDVHLLLDDELSFVQSHAIVEEVEDEIRKVLPNLDIIVHAEPYEEETRHQELEHK